MQLELLSRSAFAACILGSTLVGTQTAAAADIATKAPIKREYVSPTGDFSLSYEQQFRYVTWEGTRGYPTNLTPPGTAAPTGGGRQYYSPFALTISAQPNSDWSFDLLARGGYVDSKQTTVGQSGGYSGFIDTLVAGTVTYKANPNIQPFLSLAMNLPTGQSALYGNARFARMDPDIVFVPTFGEGFNIGPTVGVVLPFDKDRSLTLAAGYTSRGSYTREDAATGTLPVEVSPSDEISASALWRHKLNPKFTYWGGLTYAWQSTTELALPGDNLRVDPGNRITVDAGARYSWTPLWHTTGRFGYTHISETSASDDLFGVLNTPGVNANNDTFFYSLEQLYGFDKYGVGVRGSYFHRDQNEYSVTVGSFVPAKDRYALTAFVALPATEQLFLNAAVSRIWSSEDADIGSGTPEIDIDAWTISVGAKYAFLP
jgi:hypothetical protein